MKTVFDQMQAIGAAANIENFRVMQGWSYLQKVSHAEKVARTFYDRNRAEGRNVHVSVGGLDSITLHYFLEEIGVHVPCISCSTLEGKGVQIVHRQIRDEMARDYADWEACNGALPQDEIDAIEDPALRTDEQRRLDSIPPRPEMCFLTPIKPKVQVIREFGWPVLSKEIAGKIALLQNPSDKNRTVRHAIITGETGEYGGNQKHSRMKMSQKWLEKFGGADAEGAALGYAEPPLQGERPLLLLPQRKALQRLGQSAQQCALPRPHGQRRRPPPKGPHDARLQLFRGIYHPQRSIRHIRPARPAAAGR